MKSTKPSRITPIETAQQIVRRFVAPDTALVDELIGERRRESSMRKAEIEIEVTKGRV